MNKLLEEDIRYCRDQAKLLNQMATDFVPGKRKQHLKRKALQYNRIARRLEQLC